MCFFSKAERRVYLELPEGDAGVPGSLQCGLLRKNVHGTHDNAQNWECELRGFLEEIVFRLYPEETREISASVNGDDVTAKDSREDADWLIQKFEESTR